MNIENLEIGKIYKNYRILCETLEIEPMGGTVKKANIKELERFVNYHKDGIKFIIDEIYDKPKAKIIPTIYGEELDTLILDLLAKNLKVGRKNVVLGKQKLLLELAMINDNYFYGMRNSESFSKALEIDKKYIDDLFNISYSKLKSSLISSFKRLASRSLLSWKEVICIVTKKGLIIANDNQESLQKWPNPVHQH